MSKMTERKTCYVCGKRCPHLLETHHIVPRRHDGSDRSSNLVDVCPTCHRALEKIYDKSFYNILKKKFSGNGNQQDLDCTSSNVEIANAEKSEWRRNHDLRQEAWELLLEIEETYGDIYEPDALEKIVTNVDGVSTKERARKMIDYWKENGSIYSPPEASDGVLRIA